MLIANVADIHARGKDLEACRSQLAAMVAECVKRGVALVTFAGDVFDKSSIQDTHASTGAIAAVVIEAVADLTSASIEVLMVPGDHDMSGVGSADALHVFDGMHRVRIMREPGWAGYDLFGTRAAIFCLPWDWGTGSPCDFLSADMPTTPGGDPTVLLSHIRIGGALMSEKKPCEEVDSAATRTWQVPRSFLESLPFDHFALGNFHKRQDLTNGRGGFEGAVRQTSFLHAGDPAGFGIWDSETGAKTWVELDAAPRYHIAEVVLPEGEYQDLQVKYDPEKLFPQAREDDHCRVDLIGDPHMEGVKHLEAQGVEVLNIRPKEERTQRAEVPEGIVGDTHALIDLWVPTQNPPWSKERIERAHQMHDEVHADKEGAQSNDNLQ